MLGLRLGLGLNAPAKISLYDAAAQNLFDRMDTGHTAGQRTALNTFIAGRKVSGAWQLSDLAVIARPLLAKSANTILLNMKQDLYNPTKVGTLTLSDTGSVGDGTTGCWATTLNPSTSPNLGYQQDSRSAACVTDTAAAVTAFGMGNNSLSIIPRNASNVISVRCSNSSSDVSTTVATGAGASRVNRNGAAGFDILRDGAVLSAIVRASQVATNDPMLLGARNVNSVVNTPTTANMRAWQLGAGMTTPQCLDWDSAMATLLAAL